MKIVLKNGNVLLRDMTPEQYNLARGFGSMKWSRADQALVGKAGRDLLQRIADSFGRGHLPEPYETMLRRMNEKAEAVDRIRMAEDVKSPIAFPVRADLFKHQKKAVLMALVTFDVLDSKEVMPNDDRTQGA